MNVYRLMATSVTTCAAGLSLVACSVGITTASPGKSPSPTPSRTASAPAASHSASTASRSAPAASHSPSAAASPADTVHVDAPVGSFPIPDGAQVAANLSCDKQIFIELNPVTPVQASTFYTSALPRAGYDVTENSLTSDPNTGAPQGMAEFTFTGHGYAGLIIAMANLDTGASADPSMAGMPSNLTKNVLEISLTPSGVASSSACPG